MPNVAVEVSIKLGTERLNAKFTVPEEPIEPADLLPIARAITHRVIDSAIEELPSGEEIACKAGCGACCRQLVPISQTEARMLAFLVRDMPEPRRRVLAERFKAAKESLIAAGMWDKLLDRANWEPDDVRKVGLAYFHLGIPCPFLEDEACSIHPDRPLSCREYLVTSDPKYCAAVDGENIRQVPIALKVSAAMNRMSPTKPGAIFHPWVPLTQIFDWVVANPEPPPPEPGRQLTERFLRNLETTPATDAPNCAPPAPVAEV
jgi:Fe-S-cluster containining protein